MLQVETTVHAFVVHEHLELHFLTDWWTKMAATIRSENSRQHSKAHEFGEPKEVMKI